MTEGKFGYALLLAYDGGRFSGFQIQNNARTIQVELERAMRIVLRETVRVQCSGRTDAGVHATGQVVSFHTHHAIEDGGRFCHSLNSLLPTAIVALQCCAAPSHFNARFSCMAREYEYLIYNGPVRPGFWQGRCLWVREPLDLPALNSELQSILGEQDFAALTRTQYREETTLRYLDIAEFRQIEDALTRMHPIFALRVRANAFLHNMIRILVGTLLDRARGKLDTPLLDIIKSGDRKQAGFTAPPSGLYFRTAYYPPEFAQVPCLQILPDYGYRRPL